MYSVARELYLYHSAGMSKRWSDAKVYVSYVHVHMYGVGTTVVHVFVHSNSVELRAVINRVGSRTISHLRTVDTQSSE